MKIRPTDQRGDKGAMKRFFVAGVQEATKQDANGDLFYEALPNEWGAIYMQSIRAPNGSDIYDISDTSDADMRAALDTVIPGKGCLSDVTWPPDLDPTTDIGSVVSASTQRIVYGNEPPLHIPEYWADGDDYADSAETWYNALSAENKAKAWFQTGKPEVIDLGLVNAQGLAEHQDCLDTLSAKVLAGTLPARIATTHKLNIGYADDKYTFYRDLLRSYQQYFGNQVQVLFHEYKNKSDVVDNLEQTTLVMEFWLVMARLVFENGDTVAGGSFQQLAGTGTANLFGLNALPAQGGVWTVNSMFDIWQLADKMRDYSYIYTNQFDKPDTLQIEVFGDDDDQWAYFSNLGSAVSFAVPGGQDLTWMNSGLTLKTKKWDGTIPANSVGRIHRRVVRRAPSRFFSFIRNL